jgi:hypothetical protein
MGTHHTLTAAGVHGQALDQIDEVAGAFCIVVPSLD